MPSTPRGRASGNQGRGNRGRGGGGKTPLDKGKQPVRSKNLPHGHPEPAVDTSDLPRQEDLKAKVEEMETQMASRTREPGVPTSNPTSQQISELLAAIFKIESRGRLQIQSTRAADPQHPHPSFSPTPDPRRLAEVLDSLASLSVSQAKHEVIATVIRVNKKRQVRWTLRSRKWWNFGCDDESLERDMEVYERTIRLLLHGQST